ncbi:MAG: hypothetical protein AB1447_14295, partial [Bacillota bacterium]
LGDGSMETPPCLYYNGNGGNLQPSEIQTFAALRSLARERPMYACVLEGRRYDVGDRLGFLQATVEFALQREDLREPFREYLEGLMRRLPAVMENGA